METLFHLRNPLRDYDWGHETWIKELLGPAFDGTVPQAELWVGSHPAAPSSVFAGGEWKNLAELMAEEPELWLGKELLARGFENLPFLAKILAAGKPLSIQCHPSIEAARMGFADEEARSIPRNSPERNYKDTNHKPEILCALSDFTALSGFRFGSDIAADFKKLASGCRRQESRTCFERFSKLGESGRYADLTAAVLSLGPKTAPLLEEVRTLTAGAEEASFRALADASRFFPDDAGLFFFLILSLIKLKPGEALYTPAGVLHAYVHGLGVEVMANSDNVLRGGLTSKHVDVPELLKNIDPSATTGLVPAFEENGLVRYGTPAEEFKLSRLKSGASPLGFDLSSKNGPEIFLCAKGRARLTDPSTQTLRDLEKGVSIFVSPGVQNLGVELEAESEVFRVEAL